MLGQNSGTRRLRVGALRASDHCVGTPDHVERKAVLTVMRAAASALDLRPALRQVLGELCACFGAQVLERGLIVWPSNAHLVEKTGLAERSVRRAIAELVDLELLRPVDSPNRKRYAVRNAGGAITDAFGFDLAPLYGRRSDFEATLAARSVQRERTKRAFDDVTRCRKACEAGFDALAAHFPALSNDDLRAGYAFLVEITPPRSTMTLKDAIGLEWQKLTDRVEERFRAAFEEREESGKAGASDRHKEQDNGYSREPCKPSERMTTDIETNELTPGLVLKACPAVRGLAGENLDASSLVETGIYLRGSIGAHPDAFAEASAMMGRRAAALLVLYVMQLHEDDVNAGRNRIRNPGGLYRSLARAAGLGTFDLARELRSLARRKMT